MADILVPSNVSSITFSSSGVKAVSAGKITGITPAEALALCGSGAYLKQQYGEWAGFRLENANLSTGNCTILAPSVLTSITMSSVAYPVSSGKLSAVPAADATLLVNIGFNLITG